MAGFTLRSNEEVQVSEGIWTPYGPEPTEEDLARKIVQEGYKIKLLTPKRMDHYRKMATKKKWVNNQRADEVDQEQYNEMMYDDIIEDWQGVYLDEDKQIPAPCELQYKVALMKSSLDRQNFIILQASTYANDDLARREAQRSHFRRARDVSDKYAESQLHGMPEAS